MNVMHLLKGRSPDGNGARGVKNNITVANGVTNGSRIAHIGKDAIKISNLFGKFPRHRSQAEKSNPASTGPRTCVMYSIVSSRVRPPDTLLVPSRVSATEMPLR